MPYIDLEIDSPKPYYDHLYTDNSNDDEEKALDSDLCMCHTDQPTLPADINSLGYKLATGMENSNNIRKPVPNTYMDGPTISGAQDGAGDLPAKSENQDSLD